MDASINPSFGYMFIKLDKPSYFAGESLKGQLFMEIFGQCYEREIFIKFEGLQVVPEKVKNKLIGANTPSSEEI